jgi:hypothetical protein
MRMIPWEYAFEIRTHLSTEQVVSRLAGFLRNGRSLPGHENMVLTGSSGRPGFAVREKRDYTGGLFPLFRGLFRENEGGTVITVRATNGVSPFASVFAQPAALVMFYQAFFSIFTEKGALSEAAPFLLQGLLYLGIGVFIDLFYWRNVRRGEAGLRRLFGEKQKGRK